MIQPATASITPANSAENTRGQRQGINCASRSPLAHCHPCASRPKVSAAVTANNISASPPSANHCTLRRSISALSPPFITGALMLRSRGSSHSNKGAPISAVTDPVDTSRHIRLSQRIIWSESHRISAPSSAASTSRDSRRRAPSIFASSGANRPIKPIMPTALTSSALITIARVKTPRRARESASPRFRATPSSSPINVNGRNNSSVNIAPPSSCGHRRCATLQSVCVSVPVLHRNMLCNWS